MRIFGGMFRTFVGDIFFKKCAKNDPQNPRNMHQEMIKRMGKKYTQKYPRESNVRLEITDKSGGCHVAHTSYPRGHRNNPMSNDEVEAKFRRLSSGVLSQNQEDRVLELTWRLESLPGLEELFDALVV